MKRLEGFLTYLFTGIGIGAVVCTVSLAVMGGMDGTLKQILAWLAASALFTVISHIMCMDFGNLLIRTVIHFCLCFALAVTVGTFLNYSASWISSARVMLPAFLVIYVIIYVGTFLVRLAETKELNKKLGR